MSRPASVQTAHIALEAIEDDVVCLTGGQYRAILEVGCVTFGLQGEGEQEVVVASFAAFLNSLTFPIQILVRVLPIDIDGYLGDLEQRAHRLSDTLSDLAHDYLTFLQRLAQNRTLLERRFYLVVPAQVEAAGVRSSWPFRQKPQAPAIAGLRRQLTGRCEEIEGGLARCGLAAQRLTSAELASLFYACWCPDRVRVQPLQPELADVTTFVVGASNGRHRRS